MAIDPKQFSELANALQTALLLASRLEPDLRQSSRDAGELRAAVDKAATAVVQLRPQSGEKGGAR